MRLTLALLLLTLPAFSQSNPCVYQYTFNGFQFCLSNYGTVAKLESPIGTPFLPAHPIEGFTAITTDGRGSRYLFSQVTNVDSGFPRVLARVSHPNGLGRLPVVFEWTDGAGSILRETVTAVPAQKIISMAMTVKPCVGCKFSWWANRIAKFSNPASAFPPYNFAHSYQAAFVYVWKGVMLRVSDLPGVQNCAAVTLDPPSSDPDHYQECLLTQPFTGDGTLYAVSGPLHAPGATITWTYQVF